MNMAAKPKILNTRPAKQASHLSNLLQKAGFVPIEVPLIDIVPFQKAGMLSLTFNTYTGLFLSSRNGLTIFWDKISEEDRNPWLSKPVYTLSSGVAKKWQSLGGNVGYLSSNRSLRGFISEFKPEKEEKWLHPCSLLTRLKAEEFREHNISVHNFPVYIPSLPEGARDRLKEILPGVGGVIFSSGSAVDNYFNCLKAREKVSIEGQLKDKPAFSMGASATEALKKHGADQIFQAEHPTDESLVQCIISVFR